ncbi:hypothetical protein JCM3774_003469 [Rhodotorula dairenensis]
MSLRHSHTSYAEHETIHAHYQSSKAKFRPGKRPPPTLLARAASLISLPSPPAEGQLGSDVEMDHTEDEDEPDDDREIDQLASDDEADEAQATGCDVRARKPAAPPAGPCLLGSPANFLGAPAGFAVSASRKQLLNPFLHPAAVEPLSSMSSSSVRPYPGAPLSPSSSPVRPDRPQNFSPLRRRHRCDPDRIRLSSEAAALDPRGGGSSAVTMTPPSKARELDAAAAAVQEDRRRAMGWYDEDNPFVDRNDEMARRLQNKEPLARPETVTWVKRGQRVATTIPFSALLTSDSPSDDPFTFTAPKLLFPPQTPPSPTPATLPATPARQSKFLEALKAAGGTTSHHHQQQLPPTPATLKRRAPGGKAAHADEDRGGSNHHHHHPNKRSRTGNGYVEPLPHAAALGGHRGLRSDQYDPYIPGSNPNQPGGGPGPAASTAASGSKVQTIQQEIDATVGIMKDNITKVAERGERLDALQDKTDNLAQSAQGFRRGANRVRKKMWWKDMKMRVLIAVGIAVLVIVIVVPIVVKK